MKSPEKALQVRRVVNVRDVMLADAENTGRSDG